MAENPHVRSAVFLKSAILQRDYPETDGLPEVAIVGRSNVGKSSLINALVNRRRLAKVSNTPGRTQLLNFFEINGEFILCDLPGYGYAKVPAKMKASWGKMIETYLSRRTTLRVMLLLVDARRQPGDWEHQLVGWASQHGRAVLSVVTKIDKLSPSKRKPALARIAKDLGIDTRQLLGTSATQGIGLDVVWRRLTSVLNIDSTASR